MHALCSGAVALACHLVLAQVACQGGDREHLSHVKRRTQGLRVAGKLHGFFKVRTRGREIKVVQGGKACAKKRKSNDFKKRKREKFCSYTADLAKKGPGRNGSHPGCPTRTAP